MQDWPHICWVHSLCCHCMYINPGMASVRPGPKVPFYPPPSPPCLTATFKRMHALHCRLHSPKSPEAAEEFSLHGMRLSGAGLGCSRCSTRIDEVGPWDTSCSLFHCSHASQKAALLSLLGFNRILLQQVMQGPQTANLVPVVQGLKVWT